MVVLAEELLGMYRWSPSLEVSRHPNERRDTCSSQGKTRSTSAVIVIRSDVKFKLKSVRQ